MNFQHGSQLPQFFVFGIFVLVVGSFLFRIIKNGGFKAAMFGAPIERTVGEVSGTGSRLISIAVKVHVLGDNSSEKAVGLEFVAASFASYRMVPVSLSAMETRKLIMLLESAVQGK